jgi:hypothetical protein
MPEATPIPIIISNLKPNAKQVQRLYLIYFIAFSKCHVAWTLDVAGLQLAIVTATEAWGWGKRSGEKLLAESQTRMVRCDRLPTLKSRSYLDAESF